MGVLLSGTVISPNEDLQVYDQEIKLLAKMSCPVLGICGGGQILTLESGGEVVDTVKPIAGRRQARIEIDDVIFDGLPRPFTVLSKHRRYMSTIPDDFEVLAYETIENYPYVLKHKEKARYAVQFHPERRNDGTQFLKNFFNICCIWAQQPKAMVA